MTNKIPPDETKPESGKDEWPSLGDGFESEESPEVCALMICPRCHRGIMDYNGLLELTCPVCGYREPGGAFT